MGLSGESREVYEEGLQISILELCIRGAMNPTLVRTLQANVRVQGSDMHVDYADTSPQIERGINCVMNHTYAYSLFAIKCRTNPLIPNDEGGLDPCASPPRRVASSTPHIRRPWACGRRWGTFCRRRFSAL
jgi:N-methylhydantoinase B/oxoprolinase/acetone carboxylase alpha subunit